MFYGFTVCIHYNGTYYVYFHGQGEGSRTTPYYKSVRIQEGDSLWGIARQYREGSSMSMEEYVNQLRQMNGLKKDTIHTGQYLTVVYFE